MEKDSCSSPFLIIRVHHQWSGYRSSGKNAGSHFGVVADGLNGIWCLETVSWNVKYYLFRDLFFISMPIACARCVFPRPESRIWVRIKGSASRVVATAKPADLASRLPFPFHEIVRRNTLHWSLGSIFIFFDPGYDEGILNGVFFKFRGTLIPDCFFNSPWFLAGNLTVYIFVAWLPGFSHNNTVFQFASKPSPFSAFCWWCQCIFP